MPFFSPVGAGGVPKATVTATTGSPSIDSATRVGKTIYKFTGSGSVTFGVSGTCEILAIGGGGSGWYPGSVTFGGGGGGAGGYVYYSSIVVSNATYTVTVGAGGASGSASGNLSSMFNSATPLILANPGGATSVSLYDGYGASSGGRNGDVNATARPVTTFPPFVQGNTGGANATGGSNGGAGGGGATSAGVSVSAGIGTGGAGGNGTPNTITGPSVTYAGGGGGGGGSGGGSGGTGGAGGAGNASGSGGAYTASGNNALANFGGGGGGAGGNGSLAGLGGSGVVIVVVG